jgi:hypothetical protein
LVVSPHRPRRTLAVVVLDLFLAPFTAFGNMARVRSGPFGPARRTRPIPDAAGGTALRAPGAVPGLRGERAVIRGVLVGSAILLVGTGLFVTNLLRTTDGLSPSEASRPPEQGTVPPAETDAPDPASGAAPAVYPPPPVPSNDEDGSTLSPRPLTSHVLAASYSASGTSLVGYRASVVIDNPGPVPVSGWTLVVTLARPTLTVTDVAGAEVHQEGADWVFVPGEGADPIPAGGSVEVRFRVNGVAVGSAPTGCTIDGRPCAGTFG